MTDDLATADSFTAFTLLVKTVDRLENKVDHIAASVAEVKAEQVSQGIIGERTLNQATKTNGRVDGLEAWAAAHDGEHSAAEREAREAQSFDAGVQSERRRFRHLFGAVMDRVERPLMYGLAAVLVGVGIRLGAWFIGGLW